MGIAYTVIYTGSVPSAITQPECNELFGYSHPKYRAALNKKFPSLVCGVPEPVSSDGASVASGATTLTEDKSAAA